MFSSSILDPHGLGPYVSYIWATSGTFGNFGSQLSRSLTNRESNGVLRQL